jgi:hypothetical protein
MISRPRTAISAEKTKLFDGNMQKIRYADLIRAVLNEYSDDEMLQLFGTSKEALGTHSIRKYIIDHLTSIMDGPNVCAVYIRAGWSLGNTQDRYISGGMGADNFIGR